MITTSRPIGYTYWFWIACTMLSFLGIGICIRYFPQAFPIVHLNLTMNRQQALDAATERSASLQLGPLSYEQTARFYTDETTKLYVELDAGGTQRFTQLLDSHIYEPYRWQVRHFRQGAAHEVLFSFTPNGKPYGFLESIPEHEPGAQLSSQEAQHLAETEAMQQWGINFEHYKLIDSSQEIKLSKRIDHVFVYERTDEKLAEATYRLRLIVSGDKLTGVIHFVKVPEDFLLRYKELRASNKGIASAAMMFYMLVYFIGCCGLGLLILMRQRWVLWKQALIAAIIVSSLSFLTNLNQIPLIWMNYDTALGTNQYLLRYIIQSILGGISNIALLFGIFAAAESLTRKAFGHHPQLWKVWNVNAASSYEILGRTIGGYLLVGFHLAFVVVMYIFSLRYLGWWVPSDHLINPNILATYLPWLSSISLSLQAGFMEECAFRALPLATAALLGSRYGKRNLWIGAAFILQALVFGAAHATYPTLPAYARLVELIVPSFMFGGVYLIYGLLPAIFSHVFFDLVWFSLPLFVSDAQDALIHQIIVIIAALIPILIIFYALWRKSAIHPLPASFYNAAWHPSPITPLTEERKETTQHLVTTFSKQKQVAILVIGLIGALLFTVGVKTKKEDIPGLTLSREQAIEIARSTLIAKNISLNDWQPLGSAQTDISQADKLQQKFVWQQGGKNSYHALIGSYLLPPHWLIRFVKLNGSVSERAEEYRVILSQNGTIQRIAHVLPETASGAELPEEDARLIAHKELRETYQLDPTNLQEISAQSQQLPMRKDWHFIFADPHAFEMAGGQARISVTISGDQISDSYRFIHIPEEWEREQRNTQEMRSIITMIAALCAFIGFIFFMSILAHRPFSYLHFIGITVSICIAMLLNGANLLQQTIASFNTSEPFITQLLIALGIGFVSTLALSIFTGFITILATTSISKHRLALPGVFIFLIGLLTAACYMGIWALHYYFVPQTLPAWGTYHYLSYRLASVGVSLSASLQYIWLTGCILFFFNSLTALQQRYHLKYIGMMLVSLLSGFVVVGMLSSQDTLSLLLVQSVIVGFLIYLAYWVIVRHDAKTVPAFTWGLMFAYVIAQEALNVGPIPGILPGLFITGFLCYAWTSLLRYQQT